MDSSAHGPEAILSIDQGTTNSKAVLFDSTGDAIATGAAPVGVSSPAPGWVEQSADRIWSSVIEAIAQCMSRSNARVLGICLSTQRESVVAWQASTGRPLGPVIGWQDRRTAQWCTSALDFAAGQLVRRRTGLQIDAMFSAPKIRWLIDHLPADVAMADVRVGTIDSWLLWNLTAGGAHVCEAGNASRTLLFDVVDLAWSSELLDVFGVPAEMLPAVLRSDGRFGRITGVPGVADGVPILSVLADSHAALFGQGCTAPGMAKATYGTGSSVMTPVDRFIPGGSAVPTTLAWLTDRPTYAREGNILSSGATLAWAADLLTGGGVSELISLAASVPDAGGVTLVPAFSGLGAPHWDRDAKAVISGITQTTGPAHLARAAVDSVAHQICDVVDVIERDADSLTTFRADGGITVSGLAMQTQADLLGTAVEVADIAEISARGAAQLGWQALSAWSADAAGAKRSRTFDPKITTMDRAARRALWGAEVARARFHPPVEHRTTSGRNDKEQL